MFSFSKDMVIVIQMEKLVCKHDDTVQDMKLLGRQHSLASNKSQSLGGNYMCALPSVELGMLKPAP